MTFTHSPLTPMLTAILLFSIGLALSAFFSGSEIGFYRATRVRLLIEALSGSFLSRGLLWAVNHPSLIIATLLVGNNIANYLLSLAVVLGVGSLLPGRESAEVLALLLVQPFVFIYGELLPKNVFFDAPNRLLRRAAPALLVSVVALAPISFVLWFVSRLIALVGRHTPQEIQLVLARRELAEVLAEGHAVGLLEPTQQVLSKATLTLASEPIRKFMTPLSRFPRATTTMSRQDVERLARRERRTVLPVEQPEASGNTIGYVRLIDCALADGQELPVQPLLKLRENTTYLSALSQMFDSREPIACIQNAHERAVGFVTLRELQQVLLRDR